MRSAKHKVYNVIECQTWASSLAWTTFNNRERGVTSAYGF